MGKIFASMLHQSLKDAHETLEGTMKDVSEDVAHWQPGGKTLSIAAAYGHVVTSEDVMLTWLTKGKPLVEMEWAQKLGLSAPHPVMDMNWEKNFTSWSKSVRIEIPKFREYAKAVYKQSEDFLGSLTDKDISEKKVDLSAFQLGDWPAGRFIIRFLLSHVDSLTGEISAVKGLQGLKGYPF